MRTQPLSLVALATLAVNAHPAYADEYTQSPHLARVGVTNALQASANYGQGVKIGIVDTGVRTTHNELTGRSTSTCAAKTFFCFNGTDDNGHGTHVAGIAAGALNNNNTGMVGVAPKANIVGMKVLNRRGSGYDSDVANGIIKAADAGTSVINLSLTYLPTATIANAMNYAANKNNYIVNAGGNSAAPLLNNGNTTGLSLSTANRLVLVGSVGANNTISYFSNTPGTGSIVTPGGNLSHQSRWIMAPGESIYSSWYSSNSAYATASGTSMATPVVSGALALLMARWPVLAQDGTADDVLFATAQDLGAPGVDAIYGNGLLRVDQAFQPVGTVSASNTSGSSVNVSNNSGGGIVTRGAFGSMSALSSRLSNYTAFDTFNRDFQMNLSGLINTVESSPMVAADIPANNVEAGAVSFTDGSQLSFGHMTPDTSLALATSESNRNTDDQKSWFLSFTDKGGSTYAAGYGFSGSVSYASALFGMDSDVAGGLSELGGSAAAQNLTGGGAFLAYGTPITDTSRMAFSWSHTKPESDFSGMASWATPEAQNFGAGISVNMADGWTVGSTLNLLQENNGLLGASYGNGALQFGESNQSVSLGVSSVYALADNTSLLFDASVVRMPGAQVANGLIEDVSDIKAYAVGAALMQKETFMAGDSLTLSLRQPLKVYSGSVGLAVSSVDAFGRPSVSVERIGLKADATEVNLGLFYEAPVTEALGVNAAANARDNAGNTKGPMESAFRLGTTYRF